MPGVNTNVNAAITINALQRNEQDMARAMQRLSTGKRINSAEDDAAGLAVASRMTAQIKGLSQAVQNAQHAVSMVEVGEGAVVEISSMLMRMRELSVASQNGTNTSADRSAMATEFVQLQTEIDRIANNTQYNGQNILNGVINKTAAIATSGINDSAETITLANHGLTNGQRIVYNAAAGTVLTGAVDGQAYYAIVTDANTFKLAASYAHATAASPTVVVIGASSGSGNNNQYFETDVVSYQVGANASQTITVAFGDFNTADARGSFAGAVNAATIKVDTASNAASALSVIDAAIAGVDSQRATFGSALNRLNMAIANLSNAKINAEASRARVLDTDYAAETAELARTQIIAQAGIAMLSQANMQPQGVLQLLQG